MTPAPLSYDFEPSRAEAGTGGSRHQKERGGSGGPERKPESLGVSERRRGDAGIKGGGCGGRSERSGETPGGAETVGVSVPDFGPDELLFGVPTPESLFLPQTSS